MLDSLKQLILKGQPLPDEDPQQQLQTARHGLAQAQEFLEHTRATTSEKLAEKQVEQRAAEVEAAEQAVKVHELREVQEQLTAALERKAELHQRITRQLETLLPDLRALDALEISGAALNSRGFGLQTEIPGTPRGSSWRDPKLPGCADLVRRWLAKLEG